MKLIPQLNIGISRVLQKLLKHFNGTIILTNFVTSFPVKPITSCLHLNKALLPKNYQ